MSFLTHETAFFPCGLACFFIILPQQLMIGSGEVRGGPEVRFYEGSTRVPPGFHQGSTRVPRGSARAAGCRMLLGISTELIFKVTNSRKISPCPGSASKGGFVVELKGFQFTFKNLGLPPNQSEPTKGCLNMPDLCACGHKTKVGLPLQRL